MATSKGKGKKIGRPLEDEDEDMPAPFVAAAAAAADEDIVPATAGVSAESASAAPPAAEEKKKKKRVITKPRKKKTDIPPPSTQCFENMQVDSRLNGLVLHYARLVLDCCNRTFDTDGRIDPEMPAQLLMKLFTTKFESSNIPPRPNEHIHLQLASVMTFFTNLVMSARTVPKDKRVAHIAKGLASAFHGTPATIVECFHFVLGQAAMLAAAAATGIEISFPSAIVSPLDYDDSRSTHRHKRPRVAEGDDDDDDDDDADEDGALSVVDDRRADSESDEESDGSEENGDEDEAARRGSPAPDESGSDDDDDVVMEPAAPISAIMQRAAKGKLARVEADARARAEAAKSSAKPSQSHSEGV